MTFSRIVLLIVALPFAWRFGPPLIDSLVWMLPFLGAALSFLTPDMTGKDVGFWVRFLLGLVIFWLMFKGFGMGLGFMLPQAQRFGTTKSVRRLQGLWAEVMGVGLFFFFLTFVTALTIPAPYHPPSIEEQTRKRRIGDDLDPARSERLIRAPDPGDNADSGTAQQSQKEPAPSPPSPWNSLGVAPEECERMYAEAVRKWERRTADRKPGEFIWNREPVKRDCGQEGNYPFETPTLPSVKFPYPPLPKPKPDTRKSFVPPQIVGKD